MKKYLVVSDNHGNRDVLVDLAQRYRNEVDQMFHCGDSELEPTDSLWQDFLVVTGNCDYDSRFKKEQVYENETDRILLLHGHQHHVRFSLEGMQAAAEAVGAKIVFYGHTHILDVTSEAGIIFLNPGSICYPRGQYKEKTYALIESDETSFKVQYYDETHQALPHLQFELRK